MTTRIATTHRQTKETNIRLTLSLDGIGQYEIATGVGFLDHMLTHVAASIGFIVLVFRFLTLFR